MANDPPFSGVGNDLVLPITPGGYVTEIQDNFDKCRDEIIGVNSRLHALTSPGSGANPFIESGQLEVNGHFMVHRRMQEFSRLLGGVIPDQAVVSSDFNAVADGVGLGMPGAGTYSYHPTFCPGWYAPIQLMPANAGPATNAFGEQPASGGLGMQINIPAGARLFNANNEAVIFQPVSAHMHPEGFAGRNVRVQIEFESNAAAGLEPRLYAAYAASGIRSKTAVVLGSTPAGVGTRLTGTLDISVPATSTMLEIGVEIRDPAAHIFIFRKVTCSTNVARGLTTVYPGQIFAEQMLIESLYYRNLSGEDGVDFIDGLGTSIISSGGAWRKRIPTDSRRPVVDPLQTVREGRWSSNGTTVYAKPLYVEHMAPVSGVVWSAGLGDMPICSIIENQALPGGTGLFDDWNVVRELLVEVGLDSAGTSGNAYLYNPDLQVRYFGEWITNFRPLLLP